MVKTIVKDAYMLSISEMVIRKLKGIRETTTTARQTPQFITSGASTT
ncbi:MAG: hypothetical protein QXY40_03775 [Candidatus Methanomethylicia archaeon]